MLRKKKTFKAEFFDTARQKEFLDKENKYVENEIKKIKKIIIARGLFALFLPILIFISLFAGILWLSYILFKEPFNYILIAILIFLFLKFIYKLSRIFR